MMIVTTAGLLTNRRIPPQISLESAGMRILRLLSKSRARFASNVVTNSIWGPVMVAADGSDDAERGAV
ncbi:unnamed protein product [Eruca vesicaria subsp. sativa]|uniref:Uncharacterized protein n=1 Tax=Eruca vesicaria subsp. sativa TaxID=29727 RepID=A0ABC8LQ79_ERUVS|nr:unnamed protein product [Eruca vesicaria subsp. sativa]